MYIVEVKNARTGYKSTIELPSVTREQAQAYVDRCNGKDFKDMQKKLKIVGDYEYSLRDAA